MTCVVGLVQDGTVYLGGDSASTRGSYLTLLSRKKVYRKPGPSGDPAAAMLLGVAGSLRLSQLLRYQLVLPEHPAGMDTETYLTTHFLDAVRECLKAGGHGKRDAGEETTDSMLLLGYRGRLFQVDAEFALGEALDGFNAIGSGEEIAMGALYATRTTQLPPLDRLRLALEAAERMNTAVRAPFAYETLASVRAPDPQLQLRLRLPLAADRATVR